LKHVTLGRMAIVLALAAGAVSLTLGDHDRAEASLSTFYARVEKADFKAARKSIDEAVRLWPSNARYYTWRGYAASQELPSQCPAHGVPLDTRTLEHVSQAAADYRHALELNSRDAVAHHNLAWLDHLMGQDREARRGWEKAIAVDPGTAIYHLSLGFFLEETGDSDGAKRQYVAAIELTPAILDSPFFARYRGRLPGWAESVVQEATADTESRLKAGDDPILKARLGKLYLYRGNLQRATELLESAAKDLPNLPMVWFNLGEVRRLQGNREQAWACYQKAEFLDASLAGPTLRIGEMYRQAGQHTPSVESLRSASQKWAHVKPVTAGHNTRLYGGVPQPIDDLLPTTLVWYTTACQASTAYTALAGLFPENKLYASRSRTCESLPAPHGDTPGTGGASR
jgi:tetratricopeptide (TPR) repeat protein